MPESRIEDLRRRVEADPTSIAFAALAEEYRRLGRFQEAVDVCRRGLARHPAYLSAKVTLARALIELGQLDEAQRELDEVLRIAPENLAAIRARADVHHRSSNLPETFDYSAAYAEFEEHALSDATARASAESKGPVLSEPAGAEPRRGETGGVAGASRSARTDIDRLEAFLQAIVAERRRREAPGA